MTPPLTSGYAGYRPYVDPALLEQDTTTATATTTTTALEQLVQRQAGEGGLPQHQLDLQQMFDADNFVLSAPSPPTQFGVMDQGGLLAPATAGEVPEDPSLWWAAADPVGNDQQGIFQYPMAGVDGLQQQQQPQQLQPWQEESLWAGVPPAPQGGVTGADQGQGDIDLWPENLSADDLAELDEMFRASSGSEWL